MAYKEMGGSMDIPTYTERIAELERQLILIGERAVVDFDDKTVGDVDKAVPNGVRYKDWLREVLSADKRARVLEAHLAEQDKKLLESDLERKRLEARLAEAQTRIDMLEENFATSQDDFAGEYVKAMQAKEKVAALEQKNAELKAKLRESVPWEHASMFCNHPECIYARNIGFGKNTCMAKIQPRDCPLKGGE